jgi:DNA-binding NarL/FixJ family response regulator
MSMRILLVDDHPLFRAGVMAAVGVEPGFEICAQADNALAARELASQFKPDTAIVDLMLNDDDGLKLVRELRQDFPDMRIVVLSMLDPAVYEPRAKQAGAAAYVSKQSGPDAVAAALRAMVPKIPRRAAEALDGLGALTDRELQVFQQLGLGRSTKEIADAIGVSVKTIETHRENIKGKLDLPHANALVARATLWMREQGLTR